MESRRKVFCGRQSNERGDGIVNDDAQKKELRAMRKLYFLSNWMGYDRNDSFPFDFEPNGLPFGLKLKGWYYDHISFNLKGNGNLVFSVCVVQ